MAYLLQPEFVDQLDASRLLIAEFNPDQERDDHGRWTDSGGGGLGSVIKNVFDSIGDVFRQFVTKKTETVPEVGRGSAEHHISTASATAREMGVDNLWNTDFRQSPHVRAEAIRSPEKFDARMDRIETSLESALKFAAPNDSRRGVLNQKLEQLRGLRNDVNAFREAHQPEANAYRDFQLSDPSKDPVPKKEETRVDRAGQADVADVARQLEQQGKPATPPAGDRAPHYRTKGAAAKNIQAAADHLAKGNDAKSAVEHVMKFGSLTKATAQRYVRAAVKAAAAAADAKIADLEKQLKDAGNPTPRDPSHWGSDKQPFWRPGKNPTVDNVITRDNPKTGEREVLLIQRAETSHGKPVPEGGKWALPGGFHDSNAAKGEPWQPGKETAAEASLRELQEETGLDASELKNSMKQVGTYEGGGRDPRDNAEAWSSSTSFTLHLTPEMAQKSVAGKDDAKAAKWVPLKDLPPMAFDHSKILQDALDRHAPRRLSAAYWDPDIHAYRDDQERDERGRWAPSGGSSGGSGSRAEKMQKALDEIIEEHLPLGVDNHGDDRYAGGDDLRIPDDGQDIFHTPTAEELGGHKKFAEDLARRQRVEQDLADIAKRQQERRDREEKDANGPSAWTKASDKARARAKQLFEAAQSQKLSAKDEKSLKSNLAKMTLADLADLRQSAGVDTPSGKKSAHVDKIFKGLKEYSAAVRDSKVRAAAADQVDDELQRAELIDGILQSLGLEYQPGDFADQEE